MADVETHLEELPEPPGWLHRWLAWRPDQRARPQVEARRQNAWRRWRVFLAVAGAAFFAAPLVRMLVQRQLLVDKLQRSKEECRRADDNLLLAMDTVGNRIDALGLESRLLAKEELAFYKAIYDQAAEEPAERFAVAMARRMAGLLHLRLHELDDARFCFTLSIHMLEALVAERPDPESIERYRTNLAKLYADYAAYDAAVGDIPAAESQYDAALTLIAKLLAQKPDRRDWQADQARYWQVRGAMFARLARWSEAESDLDRAMESQTQLTSAQNESHDWPGSPACELIETWSELSKVYRRTHRSREAVAILTKAIGLFEQLAGYDGDIHYREDFVDAWTNLAAAYADDGQPKPSADAYRKALAACDAINAAYPEIAAFREKHAQIALRLGAIDAASGKRE